MQIFLEMALLSTLRHISSFSLEAPFCPKFRYECMVDTEIKQHVLIIRTGSREAEHAPVR